MRALISSFVIGLLIGLSSFAQSAEACGICHSNHHQEWLNSPHSKAWTSQTFQTQMARFGTAETCGSCHAPVSIWTEVNLRRPEKDTATPQEEKDAEELLEYETLLATVAPTRLEEREEGVRCTSCHAVRVLMPRQTTEVFLGPYHTEFGHEGRETREFQNFRLCAACHGRNPLEYGTGITDPEFHHNRNFGYEFYFSQSECASCHMPQETGKLVQLKSFENVPERTVRDHTFTGSRYQQLETALELSLRMEADQNFLRVTNEGIGHALRISPKTRYWLKVRAGGDPVDILQIEVEGADRLEPGTTIELPISLDIESGSAVVVELLVSEEQGAPRRALFSKTLSTGG